jgi:hypothetical protein
VKNVVIMHEHEIKEPPFSGLKKILCILIVMIIVAIFGFFGALKFQSRKQKIKNLLFTSQHEFTFDPSWLFSYLKNRNLEATYDCKITIKQNHPIFAYFRSKQINNDTVHVEYEMRSLICKIADYHNLGVDSLGVVVPIHPFQSPQKIPIVYLGNHAVENIGTKIDQKVFANIQTLKQTFGNRLLVIDLTSSNSAFYQKTAVIGLGLGTQRRYDEKVLFIQFNINNLDSSIGKIRAFLDQVPLIGSQGVLSLDITKPNGGILKMVDQNRFVFLELI